MFERILKIIVHVVQELHQKSSLNEVEVSSLQTQGYTEAEISTALSWLVDKPTFDKENLSHRKAFRMLSPDEKNLFTDEALSDLMQYSALGLITNEHIDFIIDRAVMSGFNRIDRATFSFIISAFVFQIASDDKPGNRIMLSGSESVN